MGAAISKAISKGNYRLLLKGGSYCRFQSNRSRRSACQQNPGKHAALLIQLGMKYNYNWLAGWRILHN